MKDEQEKESEHAKEHKEHETDENKAENKAENETETPIETETGGNETGTNETGHEREGSCYIHLSGLSLCWYEWVWEGALRTGMAGAGRPCSRNSPWCRWYSRCRCWWWWWWWLILFVVVCS